ncbi:MAG: alpha/beta hydrolase [Burkholderiales bacterium]
MLDPQAKTLLDLIASRNMPAVHTQDPVTARAQYRERRFFTQPEASPVDTVRELSADGPHGPIPLRLYRPLPASAGALPVLVYFHGGGWVIGDLDTHDVLCRDLALKSGCAVVSVDYRLAPEFPFPVPVDDCLAATRWVQQHASDLNVDPTRIAVGGDSAGGKLAAVIAIAARNAKDLPISFQLLIYPATDQRFNTKSYEVNGQGYLLTSDSMTYFRGHYIADTQHYLDWRASPLLADDLSGLPPALVVVAGYDPLRDEGVAYAQRLSEAGNKATLMSFERQIHGFITMGRVINEANEAVEVCAAALKRALSKG